MVKQQKPARVVWIARHAQAEPKSLAVDDHERSLTRRGRAEAAQAREWVLANDVVWDERWASDSVRTVETLEVLIGGAVADIPNTHVSDRLYSGNVHACMSMLAGVDDDVRNLLVVGHQPWVSGVVAELTGRYLDFPTATIVGVGMPCAWAETGTHSGWVTEVFRPAE